MNDFNNFKEWLETGDEVEFSYNGDEYSVTYTNEGEISFCKFYCEPTNFKDTKSFMENAKIDDELLCNIWDKVVDIYIY